MIFLVILAVICLGCGVYMCWWYKYGEKDDDEKKN